MGAGEGEWGLRSWETEMVAVARKQQAESAATTSATQAGRQILYTK
jgi:hypothetical protein